MGKTCKVFMFKGFVLPFNSIGSIHRTQKAILFEYPHPPLIKTKWEKKYNIFTEILYTITNMWLTAQQYCGTKFEQLSALAVAISPIPPDLPEPCCSLAQYQHGQFVGNDTGSPS